MKIRPITLVNGIEARVGRVEDEEVDEKMSVIKAVGVTVSARESLNAT